MDCLHELFNRVWIFFVGFSLLQLTSLLSHPLVCRLLSLSAFFVTWCRFCLKIVDAFINLCLYVTMSIALKALTQHTLVLHCKAFLLLPTGFLLLIKLIALFPPLETRSFALPLCYINILAKYAWLHNSLLLLGIHNGLFCLSQLRSCHYSSLLLSLVKSSYFTPI